MMTALLPVSPASCTLELLAGRVVPVPFDGFTVVEGRDCPNTASSPDAKVHDILATGLEKRKKFKSKLAIWKWRILDNKSTSHLLVASSLWGAAMLPHRRPCTLWTPGLGISTWSGAALPVTPVFTSLLIYTTKVRHQYCLYKISYEHARIWLTVWER